MRLLSHGACVMCARRLITRAGNSPFVGKLNCEDEELRSPQLKKDANSCRNRNRNHTEVW